MPPLYLVPGIGGVVLGLSYLAQHLGPDQPLYGLQARGVKDDENPCGSIEEMAAYYIDAVREAQPQGPYFIGGYSFGGIVAFEMARQLRAAGQSVGILAILDTEAPGAQSFDMAGFVGNLPHWLTDFVLSRHPRRVFFEAFVKTKNLFKKSIDKIGQPLGFDALPKRIEDEVEMPEHWPERYRRVIETHYAALLGYEPAPYAGRLTLFRTKAQPLFRAHADNGWGRLAQGGVEIHRIAGLHANFIQEPYVASVAKQLGAALEKVRIPSKLHQEPLPNVSNVGKESSVYRLPGLLRPVPRFVQALITAIFRVEL